MTLVVNRRNRTVIVAVCLVVLVASFAAANLLPSLVTSLVRPAHIVNACSPQWYAVMNGKQPLGPNEAIQFNENCVQYQVTDPQGNVIASGIAPNTVMTAAGGIDLLSGDLAQGATSAPAAANGTAFIQLSTNATAPAASETTCSLPVTGHALDAKAGTYAHTSGVRSYNLTGSFTQNDTSTNVIASICSWSGSPASATYLTHALLNAAVTLNIAGDTFSFNYTFSW